jgi:hypothetical protein
VKPVHVKEYTKKDGTAVDAHDRKAPESGAEASHVPLASLARSEATRRGTMPRSGRVNAVEDRVNAETPHRSLADLARVMADRRATSQSAPILNSVATPRISTAPIHIVTDPVTGRKTITNDSIVPQAVAAPTLTSPTVSRQPLAIGRGASTIGIARDERGRIQRSAAARHAFARQTGYPNGRPGYVIDHIKPLACGGADAPSNMQWQTVAEGKAKDKIERIGC